MAFKNPSAYSGSRAFKAPPIGGTGLGASAFPQQGQSTLLSAGAGKKGTQSKLYEGQQLGSTSKLQKSNILGELQPKKVDEENVEEQYINGLQDEVKILEYELKLLKDKETEEVENFSHFFKFFNDGVPINENIIAMKNLYQYTQKNLEEKIQQVNESNDKAKRTIEYLKHDIDTLQLKYKEIVGVIRQKDTEYEQQMLELNKKFFNETHFISQREPVQKELAGQIRQKKNEIAQIAKDEEKEQRHEKQQRDEKESKRVRLEKQIEELEKLILEKQGVKDREEDPKRFLEKNAALQEENDTLAKRIIDVKSQIKTAQIDQEQKNYELGQLAQARENDFKARRKLQRQIDEIQSRIEQENKHNKAVEEEKVRQKEKDDINRLELEFQNIKTKVIDPYQERLNQYELQLDQIMQDKHELQSKYESEVDNQQRLDKDIEEAERALHELKIQNDLALVQKDEYEKKVIPLREQYDKLNKVLPELNQQISRFEAEIDGFEKQLLLINEVKNFDFEEIKMIAATNQQVNGSINTLLSKWKSIEHQGRLGATNLN